MCLVCARLGAVGRPDNGGGTGRCVFRGGGVLGGVKRRNETGRESEISPGSMTEPAGVAPKSLRETLKYIYFCGNGIGEEQVNWGWWRGKRIYILITVFMTFLGGNHGLFTLARVLVKKCARLALVPQCHQ